MGKTYTVAQRLAATFPDAQLLIELRGASDTPVSPAQALQKVIRAFEPEAMLPDDLSALRDLYRNYLTGKRVLILADDARDRTRVDGLLPPIGSALLVTSCNRFALPGMVTLNLGQLAPGEAEQLVRTICPRLGDAAGELVRLCGYLPLALRLSASLLANDDTRSVPRYLAKLKRARLAQLRDPDDLRVSVTASIQLSYAALPPEGQQALAQLSVFPASFDRIAATAVVADVANVEEVLGLLRRRSLLEWDEESERYSLHDLVREFAAAKLPSAGQASLALRHARHYLGVANHAQSALYLKSEAVAGLALFDQERAQIDAG